MNPNSPYFSRWKVFGAIQLTHQEVQTLIQSIPYAIHALGQMDEDSSNLQEPRFSILIQGYLFYQLETKLRSFERQKRFIAYGYNHPVSVQLPLAVLKVLYDLAKITRMPSFYILMGSIEVILEKYGYHFNTPSEASGLAALIEDYKRLESDLTETY